MRPLGLWLALAIVRDGGWRLMVRSVTENGGGGIYTQAVGSRETFPRRTMVFLYKYCLICYRTHAS